MNENKISDDQNYNDNEQVESQEAGMTEWELRSCFKEAVLYYIYQKNGGEVVLDTAVIPPFTINYTAGKPRIKSWSYEHLEPPKDSVLVQYSFKEVQEFIKYVYIYTDRLKRSSLIVMSQDDADCVPKHLLREGFCYFNSDNQTVQIHTGKKWVAIPTVEQEQQE